MASTPLHARDIIITFDDALTPRILAAFAAIYGYQEYLDPPTNQVPNTETKAQFAKRMLVVYVKDVVRSYESQIAAEVARKDAKDKADSEVDIR